MNPEDPGGLCFVAAGRGQNLFDVVVFQFTQTEELVSRGRNVRRRERLTGLPLRMLIANVLFALAQ